MMSQMRKARLASIACLALIPLRVVHGEQDLTAVLARLQQACKNRTSQSSALSHATRLTGISQDVIAVVQRGDATGIALVEQEILRCNGDPRDMGMATYIGFLIDALTRSPTFVPFARQTLGSDMLPPLTQDLLVEAAASNVSKSLSRADQAVILEEAAKSKHFVVRRDAIRYLVGFKTAGRLPLEVKGIAPDKGREILRTFAGEAGKSFEAREWYLHQLAELGEGRAEYIQKAKALANDSKQPAAVRLAYARKLLEFGAIDANTVSALEAESARQEEEIRRLILKEGATGARQRSCTSTRYGDAKMVPSAASRLK